MRILMVLDAPFPPDIRVEKEAHSLIDAGHEVHLACYAHARETPTYERMAGLHVHRFYVPRARAKQALGLVFHLPLYTRMWTGRLDRLVHELKPDALHAHDLPVGLPVMKILDRMERPRPRFVLDLHENYPDLLRASSLATRFPQRLFFRYDRWVALERALVRGADTVVVISEGNRERLHREHGRTGPTVVVPNYVRLDDFDHSSPDEAARPFFEPGVVNLLYVGGIDPSRGLETVLAGLALLGDEISRFRFVLVGSGRRREAIETLAGALSIAPYVRFVGQVEQQAVGAFCRLADICLLPLIPSMNNALADPNKLYQYAFWEKPVLAAGTDHLEKRIHEMQCGATYTPDDPASFADSLRRMASNPERLASYGRSARASVLGRFNWDRAVTPLLQLYAPGL